MAYNRNGINIDDDDDNNNDNRRNGLIKSMAIYILLVPISSFLQEPSILGMP